MSCPRVVVLIHQNQGAKMRRLAASALLISMMITPAFAYTDEQVSACTPDVMRLCAADIPDEGLITKCMIKKQKQVSAACMMAFKKGPATSRVASK